MAYWKTAWHNKKVFFMNLAHKGSPYFSSFLRNPFIHIWFLRAQSITELLLPISINRLVCLIMLASYFSQFTYPKVCVGYSCLRFKFTLNLLLYFVLTGTKYFELLFWSFLNKDSCSWGMCDFSGLVLSHVRDRIWIIHKRSHG